MTDHAAAVEAIRGRIQEESDWIIFRSVPEIDGNRPNAVVQAHLDRATLLRAYEAVVEELDDLRGAYNDMRVMGLPDVLKTRAVLDAALAWLDAYEGKSNESLVQKDEPLAQAVRAYRAEKEGT